MRKRPAAMGLDRQLQRSLLRCWEAPQTRPQQRRAERPLLLMLQRTPISQAVTINGNAAQAKSTATGASGYAEASAQTNFGNFTLVNAETSSPLTGAGGNRGTAASAFAQVGGVVSPSNPIVAGQSFSVISGSGFGPLTVANGSMGAGYGGGVIVSGGVPSLTYQERVEFTQNGGAFVLDLLSSDALGKGFDSAQFTIYY